MICTAHQILLGDPIRKKEMGVVGTTYGNRKEMGVVGTTYGNRKEMGVVGTTYGNRKEMGVVGTTYGNRKEMHTGFLCGNLKERDYLEYLVVDVRVILKLILNRMGSGPD